jgi:hemolysin activation/secretion protein
VVDKGERFLDAPQVSPKSAEPVLSTPKPPSSGASDSAGQVLFALKKVRLQGNTVFTAQDFAPILSRYEGRSVTADDLRQLRQELTVFYLERGYLNSGAILPEQSVKDGELTMNIVEGRLSEIKIDGLEHLREFYVQSRIDAHVNEKPLNVKELQENLQLLQQNPLIQRINAELSPALKLGEATLRAHVEEKRPYFLTLGSSNNGVPAVGAERFEVWAGHRNVLGLGDGLQGNFAISGGQTQYAFDYKLPFNRWDSTFVVSYQNSEANVVEHPFNSLNIFNQSESIGLGINQPVWQSLENQVTIGILAEHRRSISFLGDPSFAFSRGTDKDGSSTVSVLRFSQDWLNRTESRVIALRSVLNFGVNVLGATDHSRADDTLDSSKYARHYQLPDGNYFFWLGQAQWIQRLWQTGLELHLQGNVQLSANPLLSLEQYALGGMNSVRGYRKNQTVTDNGLAASVEVRIPVFTGFLGEGVLKLAPFVDVGYSWYDRVPAAITQTLSSAGIGLHFDPTSQWHAELYWAQPFKSVDNSGRNLQDAGLFFAVNYSPF